MSQTLVDPLKPSSSWDPLKITGLTKVSLGRWILFLKEEPDLQINDEPHFALAILYHCNTHQYIIRVFGRTYQTGSAANYQEMAFKAQTFFETVVPCVGILFADALFPLSCKFSVSCSVVIPKKKALNICDDCMRDMKARRRANIFSQGRINQDDSSGDEWLKSDEDPSDNNDHDEGPEAFGVEFNTKDHSSKWSVGIFECDSCDLTFDKAESFSDHSWLVHQAADHLRCPNCEKFISMGHNHTNFVNHWKFCSKFKIVPIRGFPGVKFSYECKTCGEAFKYKSDVRGHRRKCLNDCDLCDYKPQNHNDWRMHKKEVHQLDPNERVPKEPSVCAECGKTFKTKTKLKYHHNKYHAEIDQFACKICTLRCGAKSILRNHMATHDEPKILCPICGNRFKSKANLNVHLLIHSGEKPFKCDTCDYCTSAKASLAVHKKYVHGGVSRPPKKKKKTSMKAETKSKS